MSNKKKRRRVERAERLLSVRSVRRDPPDIKKVSQVVAALVVAQAEKLAQQQNGRTNRDDGTHR